MIDLAANFAFYVLMICIVLLMGRLRPAKLVDVSIHGVRLPGPVLKIFPGLTSRVGLLNTPALPAGSGILLLGAKSIHTRGMVMDIDVVFVDEDMRILKLEPRVRPGVKRLKGPKGTRSTFEFAAGTLERFPNHNSDLMHSQVLVTEVNHG